PLRSSTTGPTWARTTWRWRTKCWGACRGSPPRASSWRGSAPERADPLSQVPHVRSLRLEGSPQQLGPALDLGAQRVRDGARLLVEAPHQDRRARARDRGSERAQLARAQGQLERAREELAPALLVQPVLQAAPQQVPVAA